jgi:nitrogen fixation protein FixH
MSLNWSGSRGYDAGTLRYRLLKTDAGPTYGRNALIMFYRPASDVEARIPALMAQPWRSVKAACEAHWRRFKAPDT